MGRLLGQRIRHLDAIHVRETTCISPSIPRVSRALDPPDATPGGLIIDQGSSEVAGDVPGVLVILIAVDRVKEYSVFIRQIDQVIIECL